MRAAETSGAFAAPRQPGLPAPRPNARRVDGPLDCRVTVINGSLRTVAHCQHAPGDPMTVCRRSEQVAGAAHLGGGGSVSQPPHV